MPGVCSLRTAAATAVLLALVRPVDAAVIATSVGVQDTDTGLSWRKLSDTSGLSYDALVLRLLPGGTLEDDRPATREEVTTLVSNRFGGLPADTTTAAFDQFTADIGAVQRDFLGDGTVLEFGGVTADAGPTVTVTPIDSAGAPIGQPEDEGSHNAVLFSGARENQADPQPAVVAVPGVFALPDSFKTGYNLPPSGTTQTDVFGFEQFQRLRTSQNFFEVPRVATGFWLVRATPPVPAAVPEPATVALLGAGLAGLAFMRRGRG